MAVLTDELVREVCEEEERNTSREGFWKIRAIKRLREATGEGLFETKQALDRFLASREPPVPKPAPFSAGAYPAIPKRPTVDDIREMAEKCADAKNWTDRRKVEDDGTCVWDVLDDAVRLLEQLANQLSKGAQ